jgi:glycosyltransferase involved in cell wall biosynthesis
VAPSFRGRGQLETVDPREMAQQATKATTATQIELLDERGASPKRRLPRRLRLVFLIRSLTGGGAERQLVELSKGLDRLVFDVTVVCLYDGGEFLEELTGAGVSVISLAKRGRWDIVRCFVRLANVLRKLKPDILHSYLSGQNVLTVFLKPIVPTSRVVWGVRASNMEGKQYDWLARFISRLEILLSGFPNLIVFNSVAGKAYHLLAGFADSHAVVVPNGIDTIRFRPNMTMRAQFRALIRMSDKAALIGIVGRMDPMKDYPTFLKAAAIFSRKEPDAQFVCVGGGSEQYLCDMRALGVQLGLTDRLMWLGFLSDMPLAYNGLDICTSSSAYGEGTPNCVGEAMACGVPCVVTDVGDSRLIVGNTGVVVPPRDPAALAVGWHTMLERIGKDPQVRMLARERIESRLNLSTLIHKTSAILLGIA